MLRFLWGKTKSTGLLEDALEEACGMLEREERMFRAACDALASGAEPKTDVVHEDQNIDTGERIVRRLVLEHLTVNPQQDLAGSLSLLSIVHDLERIGDYTKSLFHLAGLRPDEPGGQRSHQSCEEIRAMIEPMFGKVATALRESEAGPALEVMQAHAIVRERTRALIEATVRAANGEREDVACGFAAQYLRRVSAHLSNVASGIVNPFDRIGGEEA